MGVIPFLFVKSAKNKLHDICNNPSFIISVILTISAIVYAFFYKNNSISQLTLQQFQLFYLFILFLNSILALSLCFKSKGLSYTLSDTIYIFCSPIKSKTVLLYGILKRLSNISISIIIFLILIYGMFLNGMNLTISKIFILLIGVIINFACFMFISAKIYIFTYNNAKKIFTAKTLIMVYTIIFVLFFTIQFINENTEIFISLMPSNIFLWIPFWGWITGAVFSIISLNNFTWLIYTLLTFIGIMLIYISLKKVNTDFYEETLNSSLRRYEIKLAIKEGRSPNPNSNPTNIKNTKIRGGNGSAIFFKHLREAKRKNRLIFTDIGFIFGSIFTLFIAIGLSQTLSPLGEHIPNVYINIIALALSIIFIIMIFTYESFSKELSKYYIHLLPMSWFRKYFWSSLYSFFKPLINIFILFIIITIVTGGNILISLSCIITYTSFLLVLISDTLLFYKLFSNKNRDNQALYILQKIFNVIFCLPGILLLGYLVYLQINPYIVFLSAIILNIIIYLSVSYLARKSIS